MTYEQKLEALAAEMNMSVADVKSFVAGISVWTNKGLSLESAIAKHMGQMVRLVNNASNPIFVDYVKESL